MKLIVGLGNPGIKHEGSRHNLGFRIIDAFFKDNSSVRESFKEEKKFQSEISEITWEPKKGNPEKILLVKPLTYMNNSGLAVKKITDYYKIGLSDIWIVHDEIDLPLGGMKIRLGGSSAGHKGVESIIEHLKTEKFWRFRVGIGRQVQKEKIVGKKIKQIDGFVLGDFSEGERGKTREIIKKASKALAYGLEQSLEKAMNRFNTK